MSAAQCVAVGTAGPGRPGATTLAMAMSLRSGGVMIEADADGGVLAARYGLSVHDSADTLDTLAAALRPGSPIDLTTRGQLLDSGLAAVPCGVSAETAAGAVGRVAERIVELRSASAQRPVTIDVGRVRRGTPSWTFMQGCDGLVLVVSASLEGLSCAMSRLPLLLGGARRLVLAVRGRGPYSLDQVRDLAERRAGRPVPIVALPDDARGADRLGRPPRRRAGETALLRAAGYAFEALQAAEPSREERRSAEPAAIPGGAG